MPTWTPTTLEAQIVGELNQHRNAYGGSVPARLTNIIQEAYQDLWEMEDWIFRRIREDITLTADQPTVQLDAGFEKLDEKWLEENNKKGRLFFTTDVQAFEDARQQRSSDTGVPLIALIEPDTTETSSYITRIRFAPTPNDAFEYTIVYLRYAPTLGVSASPLWPSPFHRGWHYLALARSQRAFRRDEAWKETYSAFKSWLTNAQQKNNENLASDTPAARDGNYDLANLPSTLFLRGYDG